MNGTVKKLSAKKKYNSTSQAEPKEDKFITKIFENLDKVKASDWEKYTNLNIANPQNLFTKKEYQGFNFLALYIDTLTNGFTSSYYATFNSISKAGGKLKKGSKGAAIEFFSFIYKNATTKKTYKYEELQFLSKSQLKDITKIPCIKSYVVFNSCQVDNIEEMNLDMEIEEGTELDFQPLDNAEQFINTVVNNGNLNLRFDKVNVGSYNPARDYITMPERKYFVSESKYYATLFHEIIHWTGHESRINRNLKGGFSDIDIYSFEELIAEMGSMLICLQNGIKSEVLNSIRYLKSWSDNNLDDRINNIKNAFKESKKSKKYLETL